jgi:DNA helicase-2/ATP-dependent DNA helicase PcrA
VLKHAYGYRAEHIIPEGMKKQFFREMVRSLSLVTADEEELLENLETEISRVKTELIAIEHYYPACLATDAFRQIYAAYQNLLQSRRFIDFDDMLVYCYRLFREREDILALWQDKFHYIMVDEFQDISRIQYEIVKMLALPQNNLCIVGDDDQSIYGFRGAKPELMLNFPEDFPEGKNLLLNINYRCSPLILAAADKVIIQNKKRYQKEILPAPDKRKKEWMPVKIVEFSSLGEENKRCVEDILALSKMGKPYEAMAVLLRTNSQAGMLAEVFMRYNLPFSIRDKIPNRYEHWIARDILAYIKIALGSRERGLFLQIANRPKRYLSRASFEEPTVDFEALRWYYEDKYWMQERIDSFERDIKVLKKLRPYAAVAYIRNTIGYDEFLREYAQYRNIKAEGLFELLEEIMEASKDCPTYEDWFAHIEAYGKQLEALKKEQGQKKEGVAIETMHSSKGLEYESVWILDANEGFHPYKKAKLLEEIEEERRLFYVAMTRAKEKLHIYYTKERYNKEVEPSRFVKELMS